MGNLPAYKSHGSINSLLEKITVKSFIPGRVRFLLNFQGDDVLHEYIRREINKSSGAHLRSYSVFSRTALVAYDPKLIDLEQIFNALFRGVDLFFAAHRQCVIGEAHIQQHDSSGGAGGACGDSCGDEALISPTQIRKEVGKSVLIGSIFTALVVRRMTVGTLFQLSPPVLYFSTAVTVLSGLPILKNGLKTLSQGKRPNDDVLVSMAVLSTLVMRDALTGLSIMWLINIGRLLERITLLRSQGAIKDLLDIAPKDAVLINGSDLKTVPAEIVKKGDLIRVFPSFNVPLDGVVVRGSGALQESILTGESLPVEKSAGDFVYAGTLLLNGELDIEVVNIESETAVAKMMKAVEQMRKRRGKIEQYGEKFVSRFIPVSMGTSALIFLVTRDWQRAIASLVIACPCAVGLATPTAVAAGVIEASRKGILIKGGTHLEAASTTSAVVFDKTGTLTTGTPVISGLYFTPEILKKIDQSSLWSIIGGCEKHSTHPIAKTIVAEAQKHTNELTSPSTYLNKPGRGIVAEAKGYKVVIGNLKMMQEEGIKVPDKIKKKLKEAKFAGATNILFAIDNSVQGVASVSDQTRPEAFDTVKRLRSQGIKKIVLASGDKEQLVKDLAESLGITDFVAEALPADKHALIEELKASGHKVLMIGDGVNDAQALSAANISMAMASGRCDLAIESADITLARDNLQLVPQTIDISQHTCRTIEQNFTASVGVNLLGLLVSASGVLSPFSAALVHNMSTITVVINSLRLKRKLNTIRG